jgi:hypothetical protein
VHDTGAGRMARRKIKLDQGGAAGPGSARPGASRGESPLKFDVDSRGLVEYADDEPSAFASMLGGLIEANVRTHPEKERDFDSLKARVGIFVTDIDEGVTLNFKGGKLIVHNGLKPRRTLTIRADAETVMSLSNLKIGLLGLPVYYDGVGRGVAAKLLMGKLRVDGMLANVLTLNAVTRIFSVQ